MAQGASGTFAVTTTGVPTPTVSESGKLPSGVTFVDNSDGTATLSGTPASGTAGSYPLIITANNGVGTAATQAFTLTDGSTFQLVQTAGSSTKTVTLPAPSKAGDLLVLNAGLWTGISKPITAVSDGKNKWTKIRATAVSGQDSDGEMWYSPNAASVSSVTVTTGASAVALNLQEYSGVATTSPLDGSNGAAGYSTSPTSGPATPTGSNDLAVGYIAGHGNSEAISVTSPGFTALPQQNTTSPNLVSVKSGYQALSSTAAQSFSGSYPAIQFWSSGIALFKASSSAPPPPNNFSISASPTSATVSAGTAATSTISTAVTSGVAQSVALSATGLPTGAAASFSPSSVNAGANSTMTITTASTTPVGSYPITVTGHRHLGHPLDRLHPQRDGSGTQ